jgi:hypothetical protein
MRSTRLFGLLIVVLLFAAVAATAASANSLLPGTAKTKVTGKSGTATLQVKGGGTISCTSIDIIEEEIITPTLIKLHIHFLGCKAFGLAVNSVNDKGQSGTILVFEDTHFCEKGPLGAAVFALTEEVALEVPSTKLTINVKGSFVGLFLEPKTKKATFKLEITQKEGKQGIEKCEGGVAQTLLSSVDGGAFTQSGEETKEATLTFAAEQELM